MRTLLVATVVLLMLPACALLSMLGEQQGQLGIGQEQKHKENKQDAGGDATAFDEITGPAVSDSPGSTTIITHESWTGRILALAALATAIALLVPSPVKSIGKAIKKVTATPPFFGG